MFFFSLSLSLFSLYCVNNKCYIIIGGQHRWASAYLAACHHIIYHISDMCYSLMANKIIVVVVHGNVAFLHFSRSLFNEFSVR